MEITVLALASLVTAVVLAAVGIAGVTERLPRNRWLGVRTDAIGEGDDDTWRIAHRAAGGALIAAAGPPLLLGVALLAAPPDEANDWFIIYAAVGVITGGLIALAVRQADRAAQGPDADD